MLIKAEDTVTGPTVVLKEEVNANLNGYISKVSNIFNREEVFLNYLLNEIPNDTKEQQIVSRIVKMLRDVAEVKI